MKKLDYQLERAIKLSTKQVETILDFAIQAANDNGYMSSLVFQKAMLVFAATVLYPDRKEEISAAIGSQYDISAIYDKLNEEEFFEKMDADFCETMEYLRDVSVDWFEDAKSYAHSARGLLDSLNTLSGDVVKSAVEQLQKTVQSDDFAQVLQIGDALGVNRKQDTSIKDSGKLKDVSEKKSATKRIRAKKTE